MFLKSIKENKLYVLFLLIIGVCFYFLNVYMPLYYDDFLYCFIFGTTTPISSLGDIFVSQYRHYFEFNGRVVTHVLVQLFDGLLGKSAFNVANAVVFVLFLHLLTTTSTKDRSQYYKALTMVLICIFVVLPYFFQTFLWLSGAFNYLWAPTILLLFNQQLQKDRKPAKWQYPLLVIAGLLCGWTHEGFVFPMAAAYFVYYLRNRRELTPYRIALLIGFFIGAALLISPGSLHRAGADSSILYLLLGSIKGVASVLFNLAGVRIFILLIASLIILRIYRKDLFKPVIRENAFWLISIAVALAFIALVTKMSLGAKHYGTTCIVDIFSLIVLIKIFLLIKIPKTVCTCCNIAICVYVILAVPACKANNDEYKQVEKQLQDKGAFIIKSPDYSVPSVFEKFTPRGYYPCISWPFMVGGSHLTKLTNYYHRDPFLMLPDEFLDKFLDDIKNNPEHYLEFYTRQSWPLYAKRVSGDKKIKSVTFLLRDTKPEEIPFYLRPVASKMAQYSASEVNTKEFVCVPFGTETLLVIQKHELEAVSSRVKGIMVVYE